jgi:hypothetical protein
MALRTLLAILLISSLSLAVSGCALFEPAPQSAPDINAPVTKVIPGDADEIWRAIQKAMVQYPIQVNNSDQGVIETDVIKAENAWQAPFEKKKEKRNLRYVLKVNVVKGRVKNQNSSRVTISKVAALERDFFSGESKLPSDGLEERTLLYRIERELTLERSLRKAFERGK